MTTPTTYSTAANGVTLGTWLRYLVGGREAIVRIAGSRDLLWLGFVFVLSTGFAREYDGADLWHEPWHLILPLVASLATSLLLWGLVYAEATARGLAQLPFWASYCTLLTFYWLTALLAWLYAVPVERFLSPAAAIAANYWFLAIVAAWRVLLITRALSVWLNARFVVLFFLVMLFADSVAVVLALVSPKPIFDVMGGVRLGETDLVVLNAMISVIFLGAMSWPVWLIGALVSLAVVKAPWSVAPAEVPAPRAGRSLWGLAVLLLMIGAALLPIGQPEQWHAHRAEQFFKTNDVEAAIRYLAELSRDELPPVWDAPPRLGYGERIPQVPAVLAAVEEQRAPAWLRDLYVAKLRQDPAEVLECSAPYDDKNHDADFAAALAAVEKYVPAASLGAEQRYDLEYLTSCDHINVKLRDRLREYLGGKTSPSE